MGDVPEGYKMSEVGIVPNEWGERKFSDIVFDFRGGAPLTPNDFKDNGIKVLPKGGVTRGGFLVIENDKMQYCSSQYAENHETNLVDNTYTIVVLRDLVPSGPNIGLMVKIDSNDNFILAQGVYGFKIKNEFVSSRFLIHLSNGTEYRKLMNNIMVGSTQVHITNTAFLKLQLPLPPLPEQQAIASVLSDVDALITALEQLITKKRNIKQGAMQQLLTGKKRLPGFGGEWEMKKLGEVLKIRHGKSQQSIIDENGLYPILATGGEIGRTNTFLYNKPSVLIGRKGTIDVPQYMKTPFWTIDTLFFTEISDNANPKFIFYKFNLIDWYSHNEASGVPSLNASKIEKIELPFPSTVKEQNAIAQILSDMDTEIEALEQKQAKYKAIKQGMMQELLTGKMRLLKEDKA